MILKIDCVHFPGDRPCNYHKSQGIKCDNCNYYSQRHFNILIIKLDAIGDVLRTTSILQGLKEKYPHSYITWLTKKNAVELFDNNEFVNQVLSLESNSSLQILNAMTFDLAINLDPSPVSAAIISNIKAFNKIGFGMNQNGIVYSLNREADEWLEMGAFDDLKKNNTKTYQSIMLNIAGLKTNKFDILLRLNDDEINFANKFIKKNSIHTNKKIIGLNTGASPRWELKQWTLDGYKSLINYILEKTDYYIFLYGGEYEKERNENLSKINKKRIIDTGSNNTLREFFALLNLCDVLVTGDTLAMHAAVALNKKVVALFGPTSSAEIEDYGLIKKIVPSLDCLVCYKTKCDFQPNCMESINHKLVYAEILKLLEEKK